ncbi:hypothetical protein SDC9_174247 [bioreactor metagenome]|uniref:Uncharacterized protein n=1 Tax=bioreactor metagenome TaxID=1076179 RepID=A0A645GLS8_9ZZZZ
MRTPPFEIAAAAFPEKPVAFEQAALYEHKIIKVGASYLFLSVIKEF